MEFKVTALFHNIQIVVVSLESRYMCRNELLFPLSGGAVQGRRGWGRWQPGAGLVHYPSTSCCGTGGGPFIIESYWY